MLKKLGIKNKTVDTPRDLSSSCGISVLFDGRYLDRARLILSKLQMFGGVKLYYVTGDLFKKYRIIR